MLQLVHLGKHFQGRYLFQDLNWQLRDGDRVGLCGSNGSGKTTLLRVLAGEVEPDEGNLALPRGTTIGYLPQDGLQAAGRTLFDEARQAFGPLLALQAEQTEIERRLDDGTADDGEATALAARYDEILQAFRDRGGFDMDRRVTQVLLGLGFTRAEFEKDCRHFSGGWQMRIALARLLLSQPDILLLDEPTNHLDLEAREWLRDFLVAYPYSVVLVSHDRAFLDAVVTRIAEISPLGLLDFVGGYTRFLEQRDEYVAAIENRNRRLEEEIARLQTNVERFGAKATKAAQAQAWAKQIEKLQAELRPLPPPRSTIHFRFPPAERSGRIVLSLERVTKRYGDLTVLEDVDLNLERGARVALVGVNGAGKSTLMRILAGREQCEGAVRIGHNVQARFFAQDQAQELDYSRTVLEEAQSASPVADIPRVRGLLGAFLFSGDDVHKPVRVLSGGERNRLALLKLLLQPANLLLLDEPTNHLDIDSKDVLLEALQNFEGTIVFVSHDRYFLEQLATQVVEVGGGHAALYPGTFAELQWKKSRDAAGTLVNGERPTEAVVVGTSVSKAERIAEREAQKAAAAADRKRQKLIEGIEAAIAEGEAEVSRFEARLADPEVYADPERAAEAARDLSEAKARVAALLDEWEAAHGN